MMPTKKRTAARRRYRSVDDLDLPELLELWLGPSSRTGTVFADLWTRERVWKEVGASLIAHMPAGVRPWGFWYYDSPEPRDYDGNQADQLDRMGVLSKEEVKQLIEWSQLGKTYAFRGKWGKSFDDEPGTP